MIQDRKYVEMLHIITLLPVPFFQVFVSNKLLNTCTTVVKRDVIQAALLDKHLPQDSISWLGLHWSLAIYFLCVGLAGSMLTVP